MNVQDTRWPTIGRTGGRFFDVDDQGFLLNQLDEVVLQEAWQPLVQEGVDRILALVGGDLDGLYLRGSVAAGRAWDRTSDIDFIALTKREIGDDLGDLIESLESSYPIVREVVIEIVALDDLFRSDRLRFMKVVLKAQCRHLAGVDRRPELPLVRPGRKMVFAAHTLEERHVAFERMRSAGLDARTLELRTHAFFRAALRCGFELLEETLQRYTRDIDLCADVLQAANPGHAPLFERVYRGALERPSSCDLEVATAYMEWFRNERALRFADWEQR